MIFRLEYKNKALKTARVDIITPTGTGVETVEGTGYPFMLKYEGDKKNKGLMFLSSSAEINIYETPLFNIDTLKTSGEKDIRVNYYIDSVLEWTGFVIPDFFSREIGGDGVVSMVASDRLSVLDSEVLEGLPVTVTLRTLLSSCLAKTGLALPLKTVVDFATVSGNTAALLNHSIRSQRLTDTKGRSVNCKDIIKSILVATNSKLMQRKGAWWVVNKMQHELGGGRVYTSPTAFTNYVEDLISFTDVTRGAMRTIAPVAGGVGVFQEYGGGKLIPDNYNFKNGLTGWTNYNGFVSSTNNRRVLGYTQSGSIFTPIYDDAGTSEPYLVNRNISPLWVLYSTPMLSLFDPYAIRSTRIISPVISGDSTSAKVAVEINAVGRNGTHLPFSIVLKRPGRKNLFLSRNNEWQTREVAQLLSFKNDGANNLAAVSAGMSVSAVISAESSGEVLDDVGSYTIEVLIFGSGLQGDDTVDNTTLINSASVQFSAASNDTPKGTLYKADQGGESYTKIHDTETTVFGDYLTGGLNGYFYNYAPDDTSSLLAPNGSRSQPAWVNTYTQNTEPLPLLQQTIRQMRRMFSVAHDFIKGEIDVSDFDPLSIFEDCERRFVIVEAEFDFLRGSLQVVLEEVAYQNLTVREFIYSYFGEGDEGIRGISGISAGSSGGGGGGGMAPEPSWLENEITIDPDSGLLSVDGWHVRGDLIIEGQVNQWLAQQLVVDDARIQVTRKQDGAVADSGLVIYDKDASAEVSALVYDVNGIWKAGGSRLFTEAYNPKLGGLPAADYATKSWVETSATAYNAARLGGYSAASYPRKAEEAVISGMWTFTNDLTAKTYKNIGNASRKIVQWERTDGTLRVAMESTGFGDINFSVNEVTRITLSPSTGNITADGNITAAGAALSGTLGVAGATTLGGNVGTSNFASQTQGWRVTPAGIADFRHIFTDELQAKAFTADISQALVGSDVLTKSVAKLAQNWATTANGATSSIYVEELEGFPGLQVFAVGDRLLLRLFDRSGGGLLIKNIWATVASYVSTTKNVQRYTITVNSGGATGHTVYAGSMVLDYGTPGSGVIERTVLDQQGSPYSRVSTWVNNPWTPGNYTLHYQSGNLNGISNASGWGVYSENSFLTGKLLVGDLTKAGQFMEYENGQLNIKGKITVTGGNAATKADVDAVQVGGRNLILNSDQEINVAVGYTGNNSNLIEVDKGQQVAISFDVKTTADYDGNIVLVQYFDDGGGRQGYEWISGEVTTNWTRVKRVLTMPTSAWFVGVTLGYRSAGPASQVNTFRRAKLELGNRATDWTPAPEDVDAEIASAKQEALTAAGNAQSTANSANTAVGNLSGYVDGAFKDGVIDTAEAQAIEKYKNNLAETKLSVDGSYTQLYDNAYLTGTPKSNLSAAKTALNTAYANLVNSINTAIAGGKTTAAEKSDVDSKFALFNTALATYSVRVEEANAAIQVAVEGAANGYTDAGIAAAKGYTDGLTSRVENTLGLADLENINETLITDGKVRTALLEATEIAALVVTAETVEGLTLNFDKGKIGAWSLAPHLFYSGSWDSSFGAGSGIKLDAVSNSIMAQYSTPYNSVEMFYRSSTDWGLIGKKNNADVFKLGHENQIAGINFDDSRIHTENWELNKDGSFYFGAGGTIDGGLIAGSIESANWDGTVGSRLNLLDGSLEFGNVIRIDAVTNQIVVKDGGTGQDGVKIGDFTMSGGVGSSTLDNAFSGSITTSANSENINLAGTVTPTGLSLTQGLVIYSNIAQGVYNLKFSVKVNTLSRNTQAYSTIPAAPWDNNGTYGSATTTIRVFLGANIIYSSTKNCFLSEVTHDINISFEGSGTLRCEVSIDGTKYYQFISGSSKSLFGYYGVISTNSARITLTPSANLLEISSKGFQSYWGPSRFFRLAPPTGWTNFVTARGQQEYTSPNGSHGLRITDTGVQIKRGGGAWVAL